MFPRSCLFRSALAGAAALVLASPLAFAFGIGLQPTTVEMEMQPGDSRRQVITLANVHTEKTISLTIGLADWSLDENGQIQLTPPGEADSSAAGWVRFSPAFVTLKPGQAQQVVIDMAAPARLPRAGDYRFALLASTVLPEERGGESGVWKKYQIASLFYLTAGKAASLPQITRSGVVVDGSGAASVSLRIENKGNAHARLEGAIDVRHPGGRVETIPVANLVVLDGNAREFSAALSALPADGAEIEVRLDNIFAPQVEGEVETLPVHRIDPTSRNAAIAPAAPDAAAP